jgi:hypothetical protein
MKQIEPTPQSYIPMIKITPSQIVGYYQYTGLHRRSWQSLIFRTLGEDVIEGTQKIVQQAYTGELTKSARKKLKESCELLFAIAQERKIENPTTGKSFPFRIGLITLTLSGPQGTRTDRELKKELLEPFLRHFRSKGLLNYVWKAERQNNGNLHFHILTDFFMDKTYLTNYWNRLQAKMGFIESFHAKYGHRNPASTNVKKVRGKKGMIGYMVKYMLKPAAKKQQLELGREIDPKTIGKIWDCSLHLKIKNDTAEPIEDWEFEALNKAEDAGKLKRIETEHCTIYVPRNGELANIAPTFLKKRLRQFLEKVKLKATESNFRASPE